MLRQIRLFLLMVLGLMLLIRSGMFVVRIVQEWNQPVSKWQPANENEQKIWENYQDLGQ